MKQKEPLYRKVNSKALRCRHNKGENYRMARNTKHEESSKMKQGVQRGLDYTPLFKFLLSKVGEDFDSVFSEARSRVDKVDPIKWMIVESKDNEQSFRNENAFFNTLYVDENNKLQKVNPNLTVNDFTAKCDCCTHTFNGKTITNLPDHIKELRKKAVAAEEK